MGPPERGGDPPSPLVLNRWLELRHVLDIGDVHGAVRGKAAMGSKRIHLARPRLTPESHCLRGTGRGACASAAASGGRRDPPQTPHVIAGLSLSSWPVAVSFPGLDLQPSRFGDWPIQGSHHLRCFLKKNCASWPPGV